MKKIRNSTLLILAFWVLHFVVACGQGVETADARRNEDSAVPGQWAVNNLAFPTGGDCAPDLDILDDPTHLGPGGRVMFVTLFSGGVIAIDLDANPLAGFPSDVYRGLDRREVTGLPANLLVSDLNHAFLLTSSHLIYFNPRSGTVYQTLSMTDPLSLTTSLAQVSVNSTGTGVNILSDVPRGSFVPMIPQYLARVGNRLAISFTNYNFSAIPARWGQGIIRYYDISGENTGAEHINATSIYTASDCEQAERMAFNTTGLTALPNGKLLATCSGVTVIADGGSRPLTRGGVDLIDPSTGAIEDSLDLGMTAPSFRSWAVTSNNRAFLGSSSGGYLLELSLSPLSVVHGGSNPIVVTQATNGTDFITDVVLSEDEKSLFAASFNTSSVVGFDVSGTQISQYVPKADLSSPSPGIEGAGPLAIRPGIPGVNYTGPDLFSIRCNGHTIAAIKTY